MSLQPDVNASVIRSRGMSDDLQPTAGPGISASSVRIVRPRDLLAFTASWSGMTLDRAADPGARRSPPRLMAAEKGGLLTCEFSFQHLAEAATEPDFPGDESLDYAVPFPARAARPSRLVFTVPPGAAIDFSTAGLLAAMATLEPAVAPAATPAPKQALWWGSLATASVTTRLLAGSSGGRVTRVPVASAAGIVTVAGLIEGQRSLVAANRLIARGALTSRNPLQKRPSRRVPAPSKQRSPRATETAIEAPFRLILSPSSLGGWAHASQPVTAPADASRVELWHSRLGVRAEGGADERDTDQRIVRAIWTRDRDRDLPVGFGSPADPFKHSLRADERELIVRQTAGTPLVPKAVPEPVKVRRLALSSLGAWLDIHVRWDFEQYLDAFSPLASWDHVAPMGRDQYVRIVKPGYLFPLGHRAFLVRITYRKIVGAANPQAALFVRRFIVLGDAARAFARRDLPFLAATVGPLRTPDLAEPADETLFWPTPLGETAPLEWTIDASDHDGDLIHLKAPMLFVLAGPKIDSVAVASKYKEAGRDTIAARGQTVAFAPAMAASEGVAAARASAETQALVLSGVAATASAEPFMAGARLVIPAIQRLTPSATPSDVAYPPVYTAHGFGAANAGNVYLELASPSALVFGSSEQSGGFVKPDVAVKALARSNGLVSSVADAASGKFTATDLFAAGLPKLFGLFDLTELIENGPLALAPKFITENLDRVAAMLLDLDRLAAAVQQVGLAAMLPAKVETVKVAVQALLDGDAATIGSAAVTAALADVAGEVDALIVAVPGAPLDPLARSTFDRLLGALKPALDAADTITAILAFVEGFDPGGAEFRTSLEWHPRLNNWPKTGDPVFAVADPDTALTISVQARASATAGAGVEIAAMLRDFKLNLLPGAPLMELHFDRLAFRSGTGRKPDVDVVFGGIEFVGILGFIEVLKELIPPDGFSDPPFLDISAEGVSAGFTVALPNVAVGVMSLSNLALGADARIPFLGKSVSVGFNFCSRERPFTLAVFPLGGGGFVGLRLDPGGMILLEAAFEFGAVVAIDFGVASGSVSVMAGIYFRLEGPAGSLTGYLRIRGEVDVLGLISASIELYMALTYAFDTGKMIGEASIKVTVEVLFFSTSVSVHAKRTFAGSNGDPTAQQMLPRDGQGNWPTWDLYCEAFAPAGEA